VLLTCSIQSWRTQNAPAHTSRPGTAPRRQKHAGRHLGINKHKQQQNARLQ